MPTWRMSGTGALFTDRLLLAPTRPEDAARAFEIQSDPAVTRGLRLAGFPPEPAELDAWFVAHAQERADGTALRFAVRLEGRMIGVADVDEISGDAGELGYWLEREAWGRGLATEAAAALVTFAFEELGLRVLRSGCAVDNPGSAGVLTRLGSARTGRVRLPYRSRGCDVAHDLFELCGPSAPRRPGR